LTLFRTLACLFLLLIAGCRNAADDAVEAPTEQGQPALWSIDDGKGGKGWLFGTIHLLPPETDWQSRTFDKAIHESQSLLLEASGLDDPQAVAKTFAALGVSGGLPPLAKRVDPDLQTQLKAVVAKAKVPPHVLDRMESWAATLMLASAIGADMGLEKGAGVEQVLIRRYRADEKPISGLETIGGQLGIFDQLPENDQRAMLNATLRDATTNREKFKAQFEAWHGGRIEELVTESNEGILASPLLRERLLDGRNRAWVAQITAMIARKNAPFIAVGAAHLPGKRGVVALLQAKGYRLTRLQ
jgi:uncharacterized protein YbaP (TraB family)